MPGGAIGDPSPPGSDAALAVVIGGGGVAALEAAAALAALAPDLVRVTLVSPQPVFTYRALAPQQALTHSTPLRFPMSDLAAQLGADLIGGRIAWVDRESRRVHTAAGQSIGYDALLLCPGAVPILRYEHAITIDADPSDLTHLFEELAAGKVHRVALVAPKRMAWPLPLYEVALMAASLANEHRLDIDLTLITPERTPLEVFGELASTQIRVRLSDRQIELICGAHCEVPRPGHVVISGDVAGGARELAVDRVVALPELLGPHIRGIPTAENGFIPIDRHCRVPGAADVYAAGDATDYPVKHGSIAAQQADAAAQQIAALAGAAVDPRPFHPSAEGLLLTGDEPRSLAAQLVGGRPFRSRVTVPTGERTPKIATAYLTALLQAVRS